MSDSEFVGRLKGARCPLNFEWEIPNFLSLPADVDDRHDSPKFFFCDSTWFLSLYPNGDEYSSEGYVGLYLTRGDRGPPVSLSYSLFLKKVNGQEAIMIDENYTFESIGSGWGEDECIRRSELIEKKSQFLPSGVLTVICSLKCNEPEVRGARRGLQTTACGELNSTMSDSEFVGRLKGARCPLNFEWEIPNFLSLPADVDDRHDSPKFFFCDSTWFLSLYPNGDEYSSEGYVGLYLTRGDRGPPVSLSYSLFLKKVNGQEAIMIDENYTFESIGSGWGEDECIRRSELIEKKSQFLPSGVLTVICSLKCNEPEVRGTRRGLQATACGELSAATPSMKLLSDLEKILLSKDDCDVTLHVKEQKFETHRVILKARSSVFAAMLSHDMMEKNTGLIDIKDCDPEFFPDFLRFLYCGDVNSITSKNVYSLYKAADKYDVQDLKSECLSFIQSHLDVDSFCDVVTLALQYNENDLINQATDFFIENVLEVINRLEFQVASLP